MEKRAAWWKPEYDDGWERVKEAFRRDWEQTRHDFGGAGRDLHQGVGDTVRQAMGVDDYEPAFRFGYGAQQHHRGRDWGAPLEDELRGDYPGDYDRDREFIRYSYQNAATVGLRH